MITALLYYPTSPIAAFDRWVSLFRDALRREVYFYSE